MIGSDEAMVEAWGYEKQVPPIILQCKFFCLKVYSINGIYFNEQDGEHIGRLNEHCTFGIGNDLNNICMQIMNDIYCENQDEWIKEYKTSAPFLMTRTENDIDYTGSCTWYKVDNGTIHTHECFSEVENDILNLVNNYEIPYIPLIAAQLTSSDNLVKLIHLDTHELGLTSDGKFLKDRRVSRGIMEATIGKNVSLDESFNAIISKFNSYKVLGERVSRLMYESMQETDKIKAFIFAWTAIEVLIGKSYPGIPNYEFPTEGIPSEYSDGIKKLFSNPKRGRRITTVAHKYTYLSIFHWKFLTIYDYDTFRRIKEIRDDFTHGDRIDYLSFEQPKIDILILLNKIISNT